MATNYKNSIYYTQTTKNTVPAGVAGTGDITTVAATGTEVVGVDTVFTTEAKVGHWIYIAAQNEIRKIVTIEGDLNIIIDHSFTSDLSNSAYAIVNPSQIKSISIHNIAAGATAYIDGAAVAVGTTVNFTKQTHDSSGYDLINPIVLDGTGSTVQVTILK